MQTNRLEKKTFFLVFIILALSFGIFYAILYQFQKDRLQGVKEQLHAKVYNSFHKNLQLHLKEFYSNKLQTFITQDILEAVEKKDREQLYKLAYEPYVKMQKDDMYLKVLQFHQSDGVMLLRMQDRENIEDTIERRMPHDIHEKQVILSGYELGKSGFFYRIFFPLFLNQKYIGALEIGVSPKKLLDHVTYFNNVDGLIRFNDKDEQILFQKITDTTLRENIFKNESLQVSKNIAYDDKLYGVYRFELLSYGGRAIGEFVFFDDLSKIQNEYVKASKFVVLAFFLTLVALYGVLHFVFTLYINKISALFRRSQSILNNQNEIVFVTNRKEIVEANNVFLDFFGFESITDFKKKHQCVSEFFITQEGFLQQEENNTACIAKLLHYPELTHLAKIKKDNNEYIFKLFASNLDETATGEVVISLQDITKELAQEDQLRESELLFKTIFETFPEATMLLDLKTKLPHAFNTLAHTQLGYTKEEFAMLTIEEYDAIFSTEEISKKIQGIEKYGRSDFKSQNRKKDGTLIDVFVTIQLTLIDKKQYMFVVARDITKSEQIEKELRESEKKFRSMFAKHNAPMLLIDPIGGEILDVNISAEKFYGYTAQEIRKMRIDDINMLTHEEINQEHQNALSEERNFFIFEHKLKNGLIKTVEVHSSPFMLKDKEVLFSIVVDVTERKSAQIALQKSEERLKKAQEIAHLGSWELDIATGILEWSDEVFAILELDKKHFVPTYEAFLHAIHPEDRAFLDKSYKEALDEKKKYSFIHRILMEDKRIKWIKELGDTEYDKDGNPLISRGTVQDITEQMRVNEELQRAKEKAEDANNAKSAFLANMSHEIRTPMNAIIGLSELVYEMDVSKKEKDIIGKIKSASHMLLGTINDILDYSKIEAKKMELSPHELELDAVFTQLRVIFSESVAKKRLDFNLYMKNDVPEVIYADELRLLQVLSNLLSNGVKFTQTGSVTLVIEHLATLDATHARLRFSVIDTGIGMSEEELVKLFEPFVQADSSTTRKYGGTGLGLVIAKKILEIMGSSLEVRSEIDTGSIFSFDIDVVVKKWQKSYIKVKEDNCRVLIVDEHAMACEAMAEMLLRFKCQSKKATNIQEVLEILEKAKKEKSSYDFLLIDWDVVDTREILEKIGGEISPIVMVSSYAKDEVDALGIVGENNIITKPITSSILFDALIRCQESFVKIIQEKESQAIPNLKGLHLLLVEDNEINQEVAVMMLERTGATVDVVSNGKEGVERYFADKEKYSAILMDLQMPVMSGYEACHIIREDLNTIPIIALTAAATVEDREKALEAGMNEHLGKPIDSAELYKTIAKLCNVPFKEVVKKRQTDTSLVLDKEHLYNSLSSKSLGDKLLKKFLQQLQNEFANISEKIVTKDPTIATIIHSLKGVSGNLYANELYGICQKIDLKYKADEEITLQEAQEMQSAQERLIERLSEIETPIQVKSELLNEKGLVKLLQKVRVELTSKNILDSYVHKTLLYNLRGRIAQEEWKDLELFLDEYEYDKALEVMDRCKI
ncbi:MAG: PAS domain S-box protein [Sulfurimonadaceae bacterium]|nr:PAS domain S-box protein [Sulfurimonadaceae bacterium]